MALIRSRVLLAPLVSDTLNTRNVIRDKGGALGRMSVELQGDCIHNQSLQYSDRLQYSGVRNSHIEAAVMAPGCLALGLSHRRPEPTHQCRSPLSPSIGLCNLQSSFYLKLRTKLWCGPRSSCGVGGGGVDGGEGGSVLVAAESGRDN